MAKTTKKTRKKSAEKSSAKGAKNYAQPELREKLKKKIIAGTKGGRAGQWSARKAQLLAAEYKAAGGEYTGPKRDAQKHLDKWTKEKWTTADHKKARRKKGGQSVTDRYLPEKAWDNLTPKQKKATRKKKTAGSAGGRQFVANTAPARKARKKATSKIKA